MSEVFEFIPQLIILHPFFLLLQTFCILYLALRGYIFAYNPHLCAEKKANSANTFDYIPHYPHMRKVRGNSNCFNTIHDQKLE